MYLNDRILELLKCETKAFDCKCLQQSHDSLVFVSLYIYMYNSQAVGQKC